MADPLTNDDIRRITDNVNAVNDWAEGDETFTATMANGRQVRSPSKLIFDAQLFKAATAYNAGTTYTDATETITESGTLFAPQPSQLPIGPEAFDSNKWYVVQGYVSGSGASLDMAGGAINNAGDIQTDRNIFTGLTGFGINIGGIHLFGRNISGNIANFEVEYDMSAGGGTDRALRFTDSVGNVVFNMEPNGSFTADDSIAVGTDSAEAPIHIVVESTKTVSPSMNTTIALDRNVDSGNSIEFIGPSGMASLQNILFSDAAAVGQGRIGYRHSDDTMIIEINNDEQWNITDSAFAPDTTGTTDIGTVTKEIRDIFAANAVTVSDERKKNDQGAIAGSDFLKLVKELDPRIFTMKEQVVKEAKPAVMGKRQTIDEIDAIKIEYVENEETGEFDEIEVPYKRKVKRFNKVPIRKDGELKQNRVELTNDDGSLKFNREGKQVYHLEQAYFDKPVMEDYEEEPAVEEKIITHGRSHTGHMAQHVEGLCEKYDLDWALHAYYEDDDIHALRLNELIGPLVAYCQELEKRLEVLEP